MSTPQFSLLILENESLPATLHEQCRRDIEVFFQKFGLVYEILTLPSHQHTIAGFLDLAGKAQAPLLAVLNAELSSPLGDIFKLLQTLLTEESLMIVFGNRFAKAMESTNKAVATDHFFTQIMKDRGCTVLADPLTEFWVMRTSALPLFTELQKNRSPLIASYLQRVTLQKNLRRQEIPLTVIQGQPLSFCKKLRRLWWVLRF